MNPLWTWGAEVPATLGGPVMYSGWGGGPGGRGGAQRFAGVLSPSPGVGVAAGGADPDPTTTMGTGGTARCSCTGLSALGTASAPVFPNSSGGSWRPRRRAGTGGAASPGLSPSHSAKLCSEGSGGKSLRGSRPNLRAADLSGPGRRARRGESAGFACSLAGKAGGEAAGGEGVWASGESGMLPADLQRAARYCRCSFGERPCRELGRRCGPGAGDGGALEPGELLGGDVPARDERHRAAFAPGLGLAASPGRRVLPQPPLPAPSQTHFRSLSPAPRGSVSPTHFRLPPRSTSGS